MFTDIPNCPVSSRAVLKMMNWEEVKVSAKMLRVSG